MARRIISMNKTQIDNKIRAKYVMQNTDGTPCFTLAQIAADYDVSVSYAHGICVKAHARLSRWNRYETRNNKIGTLLSFF